MNQKTPENEPKRAVGTQMLEIWTVYKNPKDFPNDFVTRRTLITPGHVVMEDQVFLAKSLKDVREHIPPDKIRVERSIDDDPVIIEVWI